MSDPSLNKRRALFANDVQNLMLEPRFRRWIYCILQDSGLFSSNYGADGRNLPWWEGRRSLGSDILASLHIADPDALLKLLAEEQATRTETVDDRPRRTDRRTELDPDGRRRNDGGSGATWLDYDAAE